MLFFSPNSSISQCKPVGYFANSDEGGGEEGTKYATHFIFVLHMKEHMCWVSNINSVNLMGNSLRLSNCWHKKNVS